MPAAARATAKCTRGEAGKKVEERLHELLQRADDLLEDNKQEVFAVAHALESHKTLSGEDVEAVIEGKQGRGVDGRVYKARAFMEVYGQYHERLVDAHVKRVKIAAPLPRPEDWAPELFEVPALVSGNGWGHGPGQLEGVGPSPRLRAVDGAAERVAHLPSFAPGPGDQRL